MRRFQKRCRSEDVRDKDNILDGVRIMLLKRNYLGWTEFCSNLRLSVDGDFRVNDVVN